MKKIIIDKNKCIVCFKCKYTCYATFKEHEWGIDD